MASTFTCLCLISMSLYFVGRYSGLSNWFQELRYFCHIVPARRRNLIAIDTHIQHIILHVYFTTHRIQRLVTDSRSVWTSPSSFPAYNFIKRLPKILKLPYQMYYQHKNATEHVHQLIWRQNQIVLGKVLLFSI